MRIPDLLRYGLAIALGASVFYYLYVHLDYQLWIVLLASAACYGSVLLIFRPLLQSYQISLGNRVTKADLEQANKQMLSCQQILQSAEQQALAVDQKLIHDMAELTNSIRLSVTTDPQDYKLTRMFVKTFLPEMTEATKNYVQLSHKARGKNIERIYELRKRIEGFVIAMEHINTACLENDFQRLEIETRALSDQLIRY